MKTTDISQATNQLYHIGLYRVRVTTVGNRTHNLRDHRHWFHKAQLLDYRSLSLSLCFLCTTKTLAPLVDILRMIMYELQSCIMLRLCWKLRNPERISGELWSFLTVIYFVHIFSRLCGLQSVQSASYMNDFVKELPQDNEIILVPSSDF